MERPELSPVQQRYLKWIARGIEKTGKSPTLAEIGEHFHTSGVNAYKIVQILVRKGYLKKTTSGPYRELLLIDEDGSTKLTNRTPLIGTVAAGLPVLAVESRIGYVSLDETVTRRGATYALRIKGESMIGVGIMPGDTVFVRQQSSANSGKIVVAMVNDEATVKRFFPDPSGIVRLQAENPNFSDILVPADQCSILGVVVGCYRDVE